MALIGLIIDIVIVAVVVIFGIIGLKNGFLKSILSFLGWGTCLLVAIFTAKYVAGWINEIFDFSGLIGGKLASNFKNMDAFYSTTVAEYGSLDAIKAAIPSNTNGFLKQLITIVFSNSSTDYSSTQTVASYLGNSFGQIIVTVVAGILVFVILMVAVKLLSKLFDKINQTKVLGTFNKILGCLFGVLKVTISIVVLNVVLIYLSIIPIINKPVNKLINEHTYVEKFVYNSTEKLTKNEKFMEIIVGDLWANK